MDPSYDFILNAGNAPKRSLFTANSKKQRIIIVVAAATLLVVLFAVVSSVISASANKSANNLIDLVAYQSELKRVISIGAEKSRDSTVRGKAVTAKYVLESDLQSSVKLLSTRGVKLPQDIAARYSSNSIDAQLDNADKANDFDAEYTKVYAEKLTNYKNKLSSIYGSLSASEQVVIKQHSTNAKTLLGELPSSTE